MCLCVSNDCSVLCKDVIMSLCSHITGWNSPVWYPAWVQRWKTHDGKFRLTSVFLCSFVLFSNFFVISCSSFSCCILLFNLLFFSPFPQNLLLLYPLTFLCSFLLSIHAIVFLYVHICLSVILPSWLALFLLSIPHLSWYFLLFSHYPLSLLFLLFLMPSLSLAGLNHRAWWPWERPGLGPQEQDLIQVRPPEEGGQRPPAPWRWRLPGGLEERCGLGRQGLR